MLFGSPDCFAIDAELGELRGKWSYGKLRFWICGSSVGDYEDTSDLAASARWGRTFLGASPRRTRSDLDQKTPAEVYELLYGRFIEPVDCPSPKPWPGPWDREPYVLDEVGESALRDRFALLVVRRGDAVDRVLVKSFDDENLSEALVPSGMCDIAIESYCTWVEQLRSSSG